MKKIICPTDFSPASLNAVEYAAKLCQVTGAELELLNIQSAMPYQLVLPSTPRKKEIDQAIPVLTHELEKLSNEVNKAYHISCFFDIETSTFPLEEAIAMKAEEQTLVVAGTNGADDTFQRFAGSHAFGMTKHVSAPLLVIPENFSFGTLRRLVYAWDYNPVDRNFLAFLKQFSDALHVKTDLVHVSRYETDVSKKIWSYMKNVAKEIFSDDQVVEFHRIVSTDVRGSLDKYMEETQSNVLAMRIHHGTLVKKIFHHNAGDATRDLPPYPVLVLHY